MQKTALRLASICLALVLACGMVIFAQAGMVAAQAGDGRPNIVFILTDDLDAKSLGRMPLLKEKLIAKGTQFTRAFVTNSLCCPSRATILRGQYTHNHQLQTNNYDEVRNLGLEESTVATWLRSGGYRTGYIGKYFNGYSDYPTYVPPGWTRWYGSPGGGYYGFQINDNGELVSYEGTQNYHTDVLARMASRFIRRSANGTPPFFLYLAPYAPHEPAEPAPRHEEAFANVELPRPPSFDEADVSDKPAWIRDNPSLSAQQIATMEDLYRNRLRSMLAVDDMIGDLVRTLRQSGELDNTYIFFTSDNGFHMGQHRLTEGKWTAYEEDIRVPLIVRGPGVPEGQVLRHIVLNTDYAPTFAQLGQVSAPSFVDGRSFGELLSQNPPAYANWRSAFLVESKSNYSTGRPAFQAVHTRNKLYVEYDSGEREFYDLKTDPYELDSQHATVDPRLLSALQGRLEALRDCAADACRTAED